MVFHELEPKWGVIPDDWVSVGGLFFIYFSGSPPTETAKYVDPSYTTAHVTFYCKDHKGKTSGASSRSARTSSAARRSTISASASSRATSMSWSRKSRRPVWEKAGPSWVVGSVATSEAPFEVDDRIVAVGKQPVKNEAEFRTALMRQAGNSTLIDFTLERNGQNVPTTVSAPWKAVFKLAGGLIGTLAAANEELVKNDALMNFLGFFTMYMIMLFTYRSFAAGLYLLAPLALSNIMVNAYMAANNIGVNIHTLPLVTVGLGFGIDYGLYIVSRTIEEIRVRGDLQDSVREALQTSGKAVTFTAVTMVLGTVFWTSSNIRFNAEMGLLLAIWMAISYIGSQTLTPVLIVMFKPRFIMREANRMPALTRMGAQRATR